MLGCQKSVGTLSFDRRNHLATAFVMDWDAIGMGLGWDWGRIGMGFRLGPRTLWFKPKKAKKTKNIFFMKNLTETCFLISKPTFSRKRES